MDSSCEEAVVFQAERAAVHVGGLGGRKVSRVWVGTTREGKDVRQEQASKVTSITETDFL